MARVVTKIGDVFSVKLDDHNKGYFQYVANDLTQLNSDVVRVFKKTYPVGANPNLSEIVNDEIAFYAHCVTNLGVKMGVWEKVGKVPIVGELDVLFRGTSDSGRKVGDAPVKISHNWYVWKINEEFRHVGKLEGENQKAEIGVVVNPFDIVHRMRTGEYEFFYPGY
ncbi:Imm26 family immunity protein [Methylocaldum gracile subsp. desertum]|uniref:Imm26 family immunity protein n=1 Tax=Methylocaldum sp. GT1BW TaxID=3438964 RepID=UPI003DA1122F